MKYFDSFMVAFSTLLAAYYGSKWAHEFAVKERDRELRIESLIMVKKEIVLSYRKSLEYADDFLILLDQVKKNQTLIPAFLPSRLYSLLHSLKFEILNIEEQVLDLEPEDFDVEKEINRLVLLMKKDYKLLESFFVQVMNLQAPMSDEKEVMKKEHEKLIEEINQIELSFVDVSERKIVNLLKEQVKKIR